MTLAIEPRKQRWKNDKIFDKRFTAWETEWSSKCFEFNVKCLEWITKSVNMEVFHSQISQNQLDKFHKFAGSNADQYLYNIVLINHGLLFDSFLGNQRDLRRQPSSAQLYWNTNVMICLKKYIWWVYIWDKPILINSFEFANEIPFERTYSTEINKSFPVSYSRSSLINVSSTYKVF